MGVGNESLRCRKAASGYSEGDADYEKLITAVHDATLNAGKRLCGPFRWIDRAGFTCFQN